MWNAIEFVAGGGRQRLMATSVLKADGNVDELELCLKRKRLGHERACMIGCRKERREHRRQPIANRRSFLTAKKGEKARAMRFFCFKMSDRTLLLLPYAKINLADFRVIFAGEAERIPVDSFQRNRKKSTRTTLLHTTNTSLSLSPTIRIFIIIIIIINRSALVACRYTYPACLVSVP